MARESMRKRAERRFGKTSSLFDNIYSGFNHKFPGDNGHHAFIVDKFLGTCVRINCQNVYQFKRDYGFRIDEEYSFLRDIPNWKMPFNRMFFEFKWGCDDGDSPVPGVSVIGGAMLLCSDPADNGTSLISMYSFLGNQTNGELKYSNGPWCTAHLVVDKIGQIVDTPDISMVKDETVDPKLESFAGRMSCVTFAIAGFAISFMNCKNVVTTPVDPDPAINRERRKAGLKPFLRYHTINIEPMKTVLRTEGGIETNGLKKALHICRGHFATYSDSFMGRPLAEPMTVWRPAHTRGSIKEGVVISDYKVNPPKG